MTPVAGAQSPPLVTIVTPSLNQGSYIGDAIDSVLGQDYPHLEYLVIDGGSTDETLGILASYEHRLQWTSEQDNGQADAINKGFRRARGSVLGWLNADDVYAPDAVSTAVNALESHADVGLVYGNGAILDEFGRRVRPFDEIEPFSLWRLVHGLDFILQPAAFFRRDAALLAGLLDESLEFALDWDLWIRLAQCSEVRYVPRELGFSRVYETTKTRTGGWRRIRELRRSAAKHAGRAWTPGIQLYALDTLAERLAGRRGGLWHRGVRRIQRSIARRITQQMPLHADGWLGPRGRLLVPRRWRDAGVVLAAHRVPRDGGMNVEITAEGRRLARMHVAHPGEASMDFRLPRGSRPFVELEVRSDFSFLAPPDRRRLSVRCVALGRCSGIARPLSPAAS